MRRGDVPTADELLGSQAVEDLGHVIGSVLPAEDLTQLRTAPVRITGLPLRARVDLVQAALLADIPGDYTALAHVVRAAHRQGRESGHSPAPDHDTPDDGSPSSEPSDREHPAHDTTSSESPGHNTPEHNTPPHGSAVRDTPLLDGWMIWPVTEAVASKAVDDGGTEAFDDAMDLLAELTGLLTAEFAIRTLIRHDPARALSIIRTWTASDDEHVRRLASEGTRPYLPWGTRVPALTQTPAATMPILDALYRDPSDYVRRSVANHLNDVSREHATLAVDTAARWLTTPDDNTARVVRHSLRTLVKRGDPGALALLGFPSAEAALTIEGPSLDRDLVRMGEAVEVRATLRNISDAPVRLAIDYVVHHRKANGSQAPKAFKLTTTTLEPGQTFDVRRSHTFRPITTRRYYSGPHAITLQINGVGTARAEFELNVD